MEEILASIRRIIEDGDSEAPSGGTPREPASEPEAAPGEIVEVEAFRSELRQSVQDERKPPSLAEIHNVVRRELDDDDAAAPDEQPSATDIFAPTETGPDEEQPEETPPPVVDVMKPETTANDPVRPAAHPAGREAAGREVAAQGRGSIISEQAEKQVAAAFGELSDVFAANRRKSFDEMAERMLRPMLQEWLDDNLPGLVEKLVREEIERVARGDAY